MKEPLVKTVRDFLSRHFIPGKPLLLGYSGGPDSKALLYLLLECRSYFNFELHLAHVDHGWRPESRREAELLQREAQDLSIPFHLRILGPGTFKDGNWEEQARKLRLQFFFEIYSTYSCQALLLAHQAEDHAEVVLKRICEGAHVSKLSGPSPYSTWEGMPVWRPLLSIQKKPLIDWLAKRGLSFFTDPTNTSDRFLRGRMRNELFPFLIEGFGKEIVDNFCRLGKMAEQLTSYFSKKLAPHFQSIVTGVLGSYWEVPPQLEEIEVQFLLREWFAREQILVSREVLSTIGEKVKSGGIARFPVYPKNLKNGECGKPLTPKTDSSSFLGTQEIEIHIDRKRVFLLKQPLASLSDSWKIEVRDAEKRDPCSWMSFWQGSAWGYVPQGESFELIHPAVAAGCSLMKAVKEERRRLKVPSFLCPIVPVICSRGKVIYDFITGLNNLNNNCNNLNIIYIKLDLFNKHCDKLNKICYDHEKRQGL